MTKHKKAAEQERPIREARVERFEVYYKAARAAKRAVIYLCLLPLAPTGYDIAVRAWIRSKWGKL